MSVEPMPKEIAEAVLSIMSGLDRLSKDRKNTYGGYDYVSVDAFLEMTQPACTAAGLIVKPVCIGAGRDIVSGQDRHGNEYDRRMVRYKFKFRLIHKSGTTWTDEEDEREVSMDDTGPQTLQAAESYAMKGYLRTLLQIPTGDDDADSERQQSAQVTRAKVKAAQTRNATGQDVIVWNMGSGPEPIPPGEIVDRAMTFLDSVEDPKVAEKWWHDNKAGREEFFNRHKRLAMNLKRKVEEWFTQHQEPAE